MLTRRKAFELIVLGTGGAALLGCGSCFDDPATELPESCQSAENEVRQVRGTAINAPLRDQQDIAAHLEFLREFSGDSVVDLIKSITVYDPHREGCTAEESLSRLGGYTDEELSGAIYLRTGDVLRESIYWPSQFHLPYLTAHFANIGGQANILSHELWHNISGKLLGLGELCEQYAPQNFTCNAFDEILADNYARLAQSAYFLSLDASSSIVFDRFLLPSLQAGETSKARIEAFVNVISQLPVTIGNSRNSHNTAVSRFIELGAIKPKFEPLLEYDFVADALPNLYDRWRHHADAILEAL